MFCLRLLAVLLAVGFGSDLVAQPINPYRRVTDPRAITELDCDDCDPQIHRNRYALPPEVDEHGHHILAQDTGAGVITHIWGTTDAPDSTTDLRIYIDGKLVLSSEFYDFFLQQRGALRPPLDTALAGGWFCDVQMPYRSGFKITYKTQGHNIYYAISWRPIADQQKVKSFILHPTPSEDINQREAEKRMLSFSSPWPLEVQEKVQFDVLSKPGTEVDLAEIEGQGMIQMLKLKPLNMDPWKFQYLFLKVYYDGSPYPAIEAPLFDFFLSGTSIKKIDALQIKVHPDSGLVSYMPMPYSNRVRIAVENRDTLDASILGSISYSTEVIDRKRQGYLHAHFEESKPTRLGVYHPVLHVRGKGKFLGLYHSIPKCPFPVALEGDPIFVVDSNARHNARYTGGEDYYNGGWWFVGVLYSRSFAGFTNFFDSFYRLHYLDAWDFKKSFDFDLQHGVQNDVHNHYRTIGYYYKQWTPFWTSRDTVRRGEQLAIAGSGYMSGETIAITIGGLNIGTTTADARGSFGHNITVGNDWIGGKYTLTVNGESKPEWLYIIEAPIIRTITDFPIPTLRENDTLLITGTGFQKGERIKLYFDSIPLSEEQLVRAGEDHRFTATVHVPYLADREYHVVAIGETSGQVIAPTKVRITRTHSIEFETLVPPLTKTSEVARRDDISFFYHDKWSQQSIAYFEGTGIDSFVTFQFGVPRTDTFNVYMFATQGTNMGDYAYYIDDVRYGELRGYRWHDRFNPWRSDTLHCGVLYLEKGLHTATFKCIGWNDSATKYWLGADNVLLKPLRDLPLDPRTWTQAVDQPRVFERAVLDIFPNPATDRIQLVPNVPDHDTDLLARDGLILIVDGSGRVVYEGSVAVKEFPLMPIMVDLSGLSNGRYLISLTLSSHARAKTYSASLNVLR